MRHPLRLTVLLPLTLAALGACAAGADDPIQPQPLPPGSPQPLPPSTGDGEDSPTLGVCDGGLTQCGAACVDLQKDPAHCGACGHVCEKGTCSAGTCP